MDPFTHALSGALIARATAPTQNTGLPLRLRVATGVAAALFPDVDFALRLFGTLTYLNQHQGITHSLLMLPLWTPLLAVLFASLSRRSGDWRLFSVPVALGLLVHIAGDIVTAYGLQLFAPLSTARHALSLVFVIDPVVTLLLFGALLLAWFTGRAAAIAGLLGVVVYVAFLAVPQREAIELARQHAATQANVAALPQPFSPFNWMLIVEHGDTWRVARVNLRRYAGASATSRLPGIAGRIDSAYRDRTAANWFDAPRFGSAVDAIFARQAWQHEVFHPFREFAHFGRLLEVTSDETRRCAWFADLRFELPELGPSFRFGACRSNAAPDEWELVRARGRFWID